MNSIDQNIFTSLQELSRTSGADFLSELVQIFEADSRAALAEFRKACESQNYTPLFSLAHSLKSSSANIGALRLRDLYMQMESYRIAPIEGMVRDLVERIECELTKALLELRAALAKGD